MELSNGNIVALVSNENTTIINFLGEEAVSVEDYVIELDGVTGEVRNAWDLREYLDVDRGVNIAHQTDWLHMNTIEYDPYDLDYVLSHGVGNGWMGWDGNGSIDTNDYLLTAVNSDGTPYSQDLQDNLAAQGPKEEEFHWAIGQHGLRITFRDENVLTLLSFNNQASFIFDGPDTINNAVSQTCQGDLTNDRMNPPYSMIVEYEIDEANMTVRQKWGYGQYDNDLYGSLNCGVNLFPVNVNNMMIDNGYDTHDQKNNPFNPNVLEFTEDGTLVLHMSVEGDIEWSAYKGGKVDLYHPEI